VSLLSNLGGGCLTGADGPDRFVSNNNAVPVGDGASDGIELSLKDIICSSSFSLLESLSNADNRLKIGSLGLGDLLSNDLVSLTEKLSSLRVTDEGPLESEVDNLLSTDLTSESSISASADVLSANEDIRVEHSLSGGDVEGDRGNDNLDAFLIELHSVEGVGANGANEID